MLIVKVAVENTSYHFDIAYDYLVSDVFLDKIKPGCRVLVPFGGGNRKRQGIVISCEDKLKIADNLKYVIDVIDENPVLNNEMLKLLTWMKDRYFCTFFDIIKLMLPAGIQYEIYYSYRFYGDFNEILASKEFDEDEKNIINFLAQKNKFVKYESILKNCKSSCSLDKINKLVKKGILIRVENKSRKLKDAKLKMVKVKENIKKLKLSHKQQLVYDFLVDTPVSSAKEICYFTGVTVSVINSLVKKELAEYFEQEVYRIPFNLSKKTCIEREILLTNEQEKVYNNLLDLYLSGKASVSLLHGVTGSGKTLVYMKLIDRVLNDNKSVIVMVPEISLTTQLLERFISRYGEKVAIFHSAISMGQRLDEWKKVKNGLARVVIGTRSAIFAPLNNIGLIVIDEEQEYSYKSEFSPRFHARDIAKFRCKYNKSLLLLSSATPSLESYYLAKKGVYSLNKLSNRYGNARLPKVTISNMNKELFAGNSSEFSLTLINALKENFEKGEQSILLLNRRGHNTFISCRKCGEVITCPNCSISMTYHSANNKLICHYCGYSVDFTDTCPACGEKYVKYSGAGTQKIQNDLKYILPEAKILRMDADSTMSKYAYEKNFKMFEEKKYDIMIGTQMVAKGLNFPDVTLVGVVLADQSLYSDDFRSYERTFDLITQIVGRAGRGEKEGKAIIQTFTPENPIIKLAASQDYEKFFSEEISLRKAMLYPPFVDICVVGFKGSDEIDVQKVSNSFFYNLKQEAKSNFIDIPIRIFTPSKASISKINGKYRFKIVIKCKNNKKFRKMMSKILIDFQKNLGKCKVNIYIDINPDIIN